MLKRLWADHRNACLQTLALLVIGIVLSPWVLLAIVLPIGWVVLKDEGSREDQPLERTISPDEGNSIEALTGAALLTKVKELGDVSKSDLVQACGYVSTKKDGGERLNYTEFYQALLEAKGVDVLFKGSQDDHLDFIATVDSNGDLEIDKKYTALLDLKPGDQFDIKIARKGFRLVVPGDDYEEGNT